MTPETREIIARAETARALYSTRSDFAQALEEGIALAQVGDARGERLLRETLAALAAFRHIIHADGHFVLSMYARQQIDGAQRRLESPDVSATERARLEEGLHLVGDLGDERGIALLEA